MPDKLDNLSIELDAVGFLRQLVCELGGVLDEVIGLEQAEGFVGVVGRRIGRDILDKYRGAREDTSRREVVAGILKDLKTRIGGEFELTEQDDTHLHYVATRCPFAEHVVGRPALCMMTSNVFGTITAESLGYARVDLESTIARGDACCQVIVHLSPPESEAPESSRAREYFGGFDS